MPIFELSISADMKNLKYLQPEGGCDDPDYTFLLKVKCVNCGETSQNYIYLALSESVPLSHGKATVNLLRKCKPCGRIGTIKLIPGQRQPLTLGLSESRKSAPLMRFDCRGYEPVDFSFSDSWIAESINETKFYFDPSDGKFEDYDKYGDCMVVISNLRGSFKGVKRAKK